MSKLKDDLRALYDGSSDALTVEILRTAVVGDLLERLIRGDDRAAAMLPHVAAPRNALTRGKA